MHPTPLRACAGLFGLLVSSLALTGAARANGAFPDSSDMLLPAERPDLIMLGTNFGLIASEDGGASWAWTCESELTTMGRLYQSGAAGRVFAVSTRGLVYTDDLGCQWARSGGSLADRLATDAFVDPTNRQRVLAIAAEPGGFRAVTLHESSDGGRSFGEPLYTAPTSDMLTGVETATSDPALIYVAIAAGAATDGAVVTPKLARSLNGGKDWETFDLDPSLGAGLPRIISIDPEDPARIYLRISDNRTGEALAVSGDGGLTFTTPVQIAGVLTSFLRRSNGTILVGGLTGGAGVGWRSTDGGATFQPWAISLRLRALGERDGKIYGAADNFQDKVALAISTDEGTSWQPMLTLANVTTVRECARLSCQPACLVNSSLGLWPTDTCGIPSQRDPSDRATEATPRVGEKEESSGSGCATAPGGGGNAGGPLLVAAALAGMVRRRRRRR